MADEDVTAPSSSDFRVVILGEASGAHGVGSHRIGDSKFLATIVRVSRPRGTHSANLTDSAKVAISASVKVNCPGAASASSDAGA